LELNQEELSAVRFVQEHILTQMEVRVSFDRLRKFVTFIYRILTGEYYLRCRHPPLNNIKNKFSNNTLWYAVAFNSKIKY
jgi:hypothetical protein